MEGDEVLDKIINCPSLTTVVETPFFTLSFLNDVLITSDLTTVLSTLWPLKLAFILLKS